MRSSRFALVVAFLGASLASGQTRIDFTPPTELKQNQPQSETLVTFDPVKLSVKRIRNRFVLFADEKPLKDFGTDEKAANSAVRIIRELKVNQYGFVPGSQPLLEYWLVDGEGPRKSLSLSTFLPFDNRTLKIEKAFGAWVLRDAKQILFSFGNEKATAETALALCKKHRFNQVGYLGEGVPLMTYFVIDPFDGVAQKSNASNPLELLQSTDRLGLLIPKIGLVGPKLNIDGRKIEMQRDQFDYQVIYGREVLGNFGKDEMMARRAMRFLQDMHVNGYVKIGKTGFPLFLNNDQPLVKVPLGFQSLNLRPKELQVKEINGKWFVAEGNNPYFEMGNLKEDATLLLNVIQHFGLDRICTLGNPLQGGLKVLMRDR